MPVSFGGTRIARFAVERGKRREEDRIQVISCDGLAGFGEGAWCEAAVHANADLLLGRSPFEAEAIYDDLSAATGETPGGLDIALWDLAGKSLGMPCTALLGKKWRERVSVQPRSGDAGENHGLAPLLRLVQERLVDIVVPDVGRVGLTGLRRLAYYCWLFRVRGAVACSGSDLATAAALAGLAGFVPVTNAIAAPEPFLVMPDGAGVLDIPCGPGLGMEARA